nr:MAG TPA: hypothetical protein [Caudoviricetes sp.]
MQKKKPVRLDSRAGFRAVWGLIVWDCGRCTASSVGGWVSDLGCVGVCCVCPGCPPERFCACLPPVQYAVLRRFTAAWVYWTLLSNSFLSTPAAYRSV